jgi:hypothetical protein
MEFSREEVLQIVINALIEAQEEFPEEAIEIAEGTKPIGGLAYFDSLASVVVTIRCLEALNYDEQLSMPTLFIDKKGNYLTVGEVTDYILELIKNKK